ncbi:MAG: hypothetical protein CMJ83_20610 [Planctomycetes bacterium]|nr:hypothetical protein [Planctomycetota bacterium]
MISRAIQTVLVGLFSVTALWGQPVLQPKLGDPVPGLTTAQLAAFDIGKQQFNRVFQVSEGLGPIFNQNSCASCHNNPVGGSGTITVTRFGFIDSEAGTFDPLANLGGSLRQDQAITLGCEEVIPAAANITAMRVTPSVLGGGLIESILDTDILANANPSGGGVSGIVHMVQPLEDPNGPQRVGRFGWKAQVATLLTFSGDAGLNEMGITNRLVLTENAPNGNLVLLAQCDTVPDPEDAIVPGTGLEWIDHLTNFQRYLAAPPQTPKSGMTGETIFNTIGCADCHVTSYTTSNAATLEAALRSQTIRPYSDFLLHDMGLAADFIEQGAGGLQELRTPALWGLRVRDPLWHDGRVAGGTLADRIAGPGGVIVQHNAFLSEAAPSAQMFINLSGADQALVIAFLDSLGKREFDGDGDSDVDYDDVTAFDLARTGPGVVTYTADDPEAVFDVDQDGDVDDDDWQGFIRAFDLDCNGNGESDLVDILVNQTSTDVNTNLIPDECEFCQPDLGRQGPGTLTLLVCGDDLTTAGNLAAGVIDGAAPNGTVYLAVSDTVQLASAPGGGQVVPAFPFTGGLYTVQADANGRFVTTLGGGGPLMTWIVQAAQVNGPVIELSSGVQISIGL